ncbi:MAG: peptide chain release factor 1 [Candidatus Tyloplasma litorale]|nr:MAG: peptide chain release factor 1 [Mycoplasmatales bacterium]
MESQLLEKIKKINDEYIEANENLMKPEVISNIKKFTSLNKIIKKNKSKVDLYNEWKALIDDNNTLKELMEIEEDSNNIKELRQSINLNKTNIEEVESKLKELMIDKDPNDEKDVIVEIQGAAGGDESKIFVGDLFRAYQKYFSKMDFSIELIEDNESESGGYSNISFYVRGVDVYGHLKFESGVHRVQRIPVTETQGRVHTSTVTVSVMPEVEEFDVEINPNDLRIDTYRSGGKGGQHANKTDSAVRITHIPTGIVAQSQDGRSQHHNKDIAMQLLRSRIYEIKLKEETSNLANEKKVLIGTGDRSEKIRTYNYPQNRITDHRIGLTLKKLDRVMDGSLNEIIDVLISTFNSK